MKTLDEWIKIYENKTGEMHELPNGYEQYFLPDRGYCQYIMDTERDVLYIYELCGDAKFWFDLGVVMCKQNKLRYITSICIRHIKPYIRFWGWHIDEVLHEENGAVRMNGKNKEGLAVTISTAWLNNDTGEYAYYCTSEVNRK